MNARPQIAAAVIQYHPNRRCPPLLHNHPVAVVRAQGPAAAAVDGGAEEEGLVVHVDGSGLRTMADLREALHRARGGAAAIAAAAAGHGDGADGRHGHVGTRLVVDLAGGTLRASDAGGGGGGQGRGGGRGRGGAGGGRGAHHYHGGSWDIDTPGATLRNGALLLPQGGELVVSATGVRLASLTLRGTGDGRLRILAGGSVDVTGCTLHGAAIWVEAGGTASLRRCDVGHCTGATDGVAVKGSAVVADSSSHDNNRGGFAALYGGQLRLLGSCTAFSNRVAGFVSAGEASQLVAEGPCIAERNGCGFSALNGGVMLLHGGCVSRSNCNGGYGAEGRMGGRAEGRAARLTAVGACTSQEDGKQGFWAFDGGHVILHGGCHAVATNGHGFSCINPGSVLQAGPGCGAVGPSKCGFIAEHGGRVEAGAGCAAHRAGHAGFMCTDDGAALAAGEGCLAVGCEITGFGAAQGGQLQCGTACMVVGASLTGWLCMDDGSRLTAGDRCQALGCKQAGFMASGRGCVEAGAECLAIGDGTRGFDSGGAGSVMRVGRACHVSGARNSGFCAREGSVLEVGEECRSVSSTIGFVARGASSQLRTDRGCRAERLVVGFAALDGAHVECMEGCEAQVCQAQGFVCRGRQSRMLLGRGCRALHALSEAPEDGTPEYEASDGAMLARVE